MDLTSFLVIKEITQPQQEKVVKRNEAERKNTVKKVYQFEEIRNLILQTAKEINLSLDAFLYNPPRPSNFLYSYYLLVNLKQLTKDYFPAEFNAKFIPRTEKAIRLLEAQAQKDYLALPTLKDLIAEYVSRFSADSYDIQNFEQKLDSKFYRLQKLEAEIWGKVLVPRPPKRQAVVYLSTIVTKTPFPFLKSLAKMLVDFVEGKGKRINDLDLYKFYIQELEKEGGYEGYQY
jgi:hypothetical protein